MSDENNATKPNASRSTHGLYCIYDKAAKMVLGGAIARLKSDALATRQFKELLQDDKTNIGKYPREHSIIKVGYQYDDNGHIHAIVPETIADGHEWERERNKNQMDMFEREKEIRAQMRNDANVQQEEIN